MYYSPLIKKAIDFAIAIHETESHKKRKGKDIPYIVHPLTVGLILSRVTDKEHVIAAGILHDTIEDCVPYGSVTKESLTGMFNSEVAELVWSVSEHDKSLPWKERKQRDEVEMEHMTQDQLLLKSADVLHNLTDLVTDVEQKGVLVFKNFNAPMDEILARYQRLITILRTHSPTNPLVEEIEAMYGKLIYIIES